MQIKRLFFAAAVLCLILAAIGIYWYQKPRASLNDVKPAYILSAEELYTAFKQNEAKANEQFIDKIIQVEGRIGDVQQTDSTLNILLSAGNEMGGISCRISKNNIDRKLSLTKGSMIEVKGRCIGFLMDVNLVDAVLVDN